MNYIEQEKLIHKTYPGFLGQHALNFFMEPNNDQKFIVNEKILFDRNKEYIVTENLPSSNEKIVYVSKSNNIFRIKKNLYLLKKND